MLKNYLSIALRQFRRHTLYASINVLGLAIGVAVVLLIVLFVRFEFSYDTSHSKADRIYRVVQDQPGNLFLGSTSFAVTPAPLPGALRDEIPEVEDAVQIDNVEALLIGGTKGLYEDGIFATPTFFDIFDFPLRSGNVETAITQPNTAVITPELARKLYGTDDAIGRTFDMKYFDETYLITVTGLVDPPPANSHIQFDYIVSYATYPSRAKNLDSWGNSSYFTYALLRPGTDPAAFERSVLRMTQTHLAELSWIREGRSEMPVYYTQALKDIHLKSHINFEMGRNGDVRYLYLVGLAALVILLTACVNYMNLATARAGMRAREVGVRKVAGADHRQLVRQFLGESILTTVGATILAVGIVAILMEPFNLLVEREIPRSALFEGSFIPFLVLLALVVGLLAGSYPALFLSRFSPARVLKASGAGGSARSRLRNALVVVQFAIGVFLVVGVLVIRNQLQYIQDADTGMNREQIVVMRVRDQAIEDQYDSIAGELERLPGVVGVSAAGHLPTDIRSSSGSDDWDGHEEGQEITLYNTGVTYGFIEMLGLELVEGRSFSEDRTADEGEGLIINETAMRTLGWDTAVGKRLDFGSRGHTVIGVMKDFPFHSFHSEILSLAFYLDFDWLSRMFIKIEPQNVAATLAGIENTVASFSSDYPFEYEFLDDAYNNLYRNERRLGLLLVIVTGLALVIACMGLFGLAAFLALQRTKEIGVRKALGAGVVDIVVLLSRDFSRLVLMAFLIGSPLAWYVMNRWLSDFAFRIDVGWPIFAAAAVFSFGIAWLTVGYQSVKASLTDPVNALRHE